MKKIILSLNLALANVAFAANSDKALDDELAYLRAERYVYSASKKMQKVNDVAAAVFVISQEDIRRSGVTSIPEALRMVPGLQVAQIDANKWAISARGFNNRLSNKLLVMIDGRTVYTPIFSGALWNREDTLLEDVERIEVIRGAGAAMWGANAVNGVINIITKNAKDTHGALLTAGGGNQEKGFGSVRYGDKIGDNFDYRVYGKAFQRNHNVTLNRQNAADDWENYQGGFKTEWQLSKQDTLTTQGDIYQSRAGNKEDLVLNVSPFSVVRGVDSPAQQSGGNILTRWKHKISDTSETALQVYYKHDDTHWLFITPLKVHERTVDIDFQHRFNFLEQHDVLWGLGYRYYAYAANESVKGGAAPGNIQLFSAFLQDDINLLKDQLKLTLGARLEHNDFTGFEMQPNIRLLWTPDNKQSVWGSISRAVRTPSLFEARAKSLTNTPPAGLPLPAVVLMTGNPQLKAETVLDYELGYRIQPLATLSIDVTAFYNQYNRLMAAEISPVVVTYSPLHIEIPVQQVNKMKGETLGFELASQWHPVNWLKMQASYSFLKMNLHADKGMYADGELVEKDAPQQQFNFKTSVNLPYNVEWDSMVRYVDTVSNRQTPSYVAVDMRLGWKPLKNVEFSLVGQNLFDNLHPEFKDSLFELPQTQIRRSVFGKVSVSF